MANETKLPPCALCKCPAVRDHDIDDETPGYICSSEDGVCPMSCVAVSEVEWTCLHARPKLAPEYVEALRAVQTEVCPRLPKTGHFINAAVRAALAALGEEVTP